MSEFMPSMSSAPPAKRVRSWRRWLLAFFVFSLAIGGGLLYYLWASADLNGIIAKLDRTDPGWRLEDIEAKRKSFPDASNSALQVLAVFQLQKGQSVDTPAIMFDNLPAQAQLNDQQAAYLKKRFEVLGAAVLEARKLKDMPDGRFPIKYGADFFSAIDFDALHKARAVADLLQWDVRLRGQFGDATGAMESCLALQHAGRSIGDESSLISLLVRYACDAVAVDAIERALAQSALTQASKPMLKRLQAALAQEVAERLFRTALRGERAGLHQYFTALGGKAVPIADIINARHHGALLRLHTAALDAERLPLEEREARFNALEKEAKDGPAQVRELMDSIIKVRGGELRNQAKLRCALTGLAVERFRLAKNVWPKSLNVLVESGFLDAVPMDPYDGRPLRLRQAAGGVIIYSVGPDRIDNNGAIDRHNPFASGSDLGFQLWDVSHRRQPSIPPVVAAGKDMLK